MPCVRKLGDEHLKEGIIAKVVLTVITTKEHLRLVRNAKRYHQSSTTIRPIIQVFTRYGEVPTGLTCTRSRWAPGGSIGLSG